MAAESLHLPIWPEIALSYLLFAAAMVWSLGYWFTSDTVIRINPALWSRTKRKRIQGNVQLRYRLVKHGVAAGISCIFVLALCATYETNYLIELTRMAGILMPASDPMPSNHACRNPVNDEVLVMYGSNGSIVDSFPHTILRSGAIGPILSVDRLKDGSIAVIMDVKDSNGNIAVRFNQNGFEVNNNQIMSMHRPDRSTIVIEDQQGLETSIRYTNKQAVTVNGSFHYPGQREAIPLQISRNISRLCTVAVGTDILIP